VQSSVLEYLEASARAMPDKLAIVDGERSLTFAALQSEALCLARQIERAGSPAGRPIGVYLPKSAAAVTAFMAALYAGGFYVPLDTKNPPARIAKILGNLEPEVVVTSAELKGELIAAGIEKSRIICVDAPSEDIAAATEESAEAQGKTPLTPGRSSDDPVYIIYTSGSTGEPKGVVITHRGVIDYIDWAKECYAVDSNGVIGSQAPFHFDNSTLDIYLMLATGATLVLIAEDRFMFPAKLLETMVQNQVDTIFWVPSVLVHVANLKMLEKSSLPPLSRILFAGEVMPVKHLNYWRRHFPQALFSNLYGPTEITVDCTYYIVDREFSEGDSLPIGCACPYTGVFILGDKGELTQPGQIGELCVSGTGLALGYWKNSEATAAAFTESPIEAHKGERIYRTGDLVQRNDHGELLFVGRKDSQIKHMGYRIELGEIEDAALALPGVENACVLYHREKQSITLFYLAVEEMPPAQFIRGLQGSVPKYAVPRKYHHLDSFPINSNGKIDRIALKRQYFGAPERADTT